MSLRSNVSMENLKAIRNSMFRLKIKNLIMNSIDRINKQRIVRSFPTSAALNVTNLCNLRCKFCEIHYFYKKAKEQSGKVFPNHLDVDILKNSDEWLKYVTGIELSGATGEAFVNPNIIEVIYWLKKYYIRLSATTNGLLIDEAIAGELIKAKFDSLLFSIHAGDGRTYTYLHGGDFNRVLSNLESVVALKKRLAANYPRISVNFALNQKNAHSLKDLIKWSKDIGVDAFIMNHYYDCRNALNEDISFYSDVERCNKLLKDAYDYAKKIGLKMIPAEPPYLANMNEREVNNDSGRRCKEPWTTIKFKGCVEYENCEYISVCNRVLLFRIDYKRFYGNEENSFLKNIWNSEVLQFLRETVNSKESNPVCRFCSDPNTSRIRCIDNAEYSRLRDQTIRDFFNEFRNRYEIKQIGGLVLLDENPYKYDEKDGF